MTDEGLQQVQFSIEHSADGIVWIAPDGQFLYVNQTICEMLGYQRDELLAMRITDLNPDYPPDRWQARWPILLRDGGARLTTRHRHRDGHVLTVDVHTRVLHYGEQTYLCSFVREVNPTQLNEPSPPPEPPIELNERQIEVLRLFAAGYTYEEIGQQLHLSRHTVRYHMRTISVRMKITSRAELVALAQRLPASQPNEAETITK